jgi:hypothetical protein
MPSFIKNLTLDSGFHERQHHARVGLGADGLAPSVARVGENGRDGPTREAM